MINSFRLNFFCFYVDYPFCLPPNCKMRSAYSLKPYAYKVKTLKNINSKQFLTFRTKFFLFYLLFRTFTGNADEKIVKYFFSFYKLNYTTLLVLHKPFKMDTKTLNKESSCLMCTFSEFVLFFFHMIFNFDPR